MTMSPGDYYPYCFHIACKEFKDLDKGQSLALFRFFMQAHAGSKEAQGGEAVTAVFATVMNEIFKSVDSDFAWTPHGAETAAVTDTSALRNFKQSVSRNNGTMIMDYITASLAVRLIMSGMGKPMTQHCIETVRLAYSKHILPHLHT